VSEQINLKVMKTTSENNNMTGGALMLKVELDRQLMVRVEDHPGALAKMIETISSSGINILAVCAYSVDSTAAFMFVTDDNNATRKLLEDKQYKISEEEVVVVTIPNKPGALQEVTDTIAQFNVDLCLMYGSVDKSSETSRIVMIAKSNLDLIMILKQRFGRH